MSFLRRCTNLSSLLLKSNSRNILKNHSVRYFSNRSSNDGGSGNNKKASDLKLEEYLRNYQPSKECERECSENYHFALPEREPKPQNTKTDRSSSSSIPKQDAASLWRDKLPRKCIERIICPPKEEIKKPKKKDDLSKFTRCTPGKVFHKKCPRICMPGCKAVREKCVKKRRPRDCEKATAPYPSFSECRRPTPKWIPPNECTCWLQYTICAELKRKQKLRDRGEDPDKCKFLRQKR